MRFSTNFQFPTYAHIPGKTPHPNKEGGHSYLKDEPDCKKLVYEKINNNECFWFGVDLFNHKYFWEAHVYWESVWILSKDDESAESFLKGLIKIAAGCLKIKMNQVDVGIDLINKSKDLLREDYLNVPALLATDSKAWTDFYKNIEKLVFIELPFKRDVNEQR